MTDLPRDKDPFFARKRYDLSELEPHANRDMSAAVKAKGYDGRYLGGKFGSAEGLLQDMGWVATQDLDGQIEVSLSYSHKRPNNWEVMRAFSRFGWQYFREESKATGKVRHFVVQRGMVS